jgi:CheY-like chemotaxis protein
VPIRPNSYPVLIANDGIEALDVSRRFKGHIDLLISDVMMPGMNGIDLCHGGGQGTAPHQSVAGVGRA